MAIVGGGINGCMLARGATRAGLRTVLVEKLDFGAGVTSRSTRLVHGGLRYLERFQISLVRESLKDRELLLREFKGLVEPRAFLLPHYASDTRPAWYIAAGLALYRLLGVGGSSPAPRRLSVAETLALQPGLDSQGLRCGFEYFDCQAVFPERLALEAALQAAEAGAEIRNHTQVTGFVIKESAVRGIRTEGPDGMDILRCRLVVNAAGAWVDRVLALLPDPPRAPLLRLVNGSHIVVSGFPGSPRHAVYREARSDSRPFFVIPWRGLHLIGTTESAFDGDPDTVVPSRQEIQYLIDETNHLFPGAALDPQRVLYAYCGSRPLVNSRASNLNAASRGHAVVDHERTDGIQGLLTMAGGKLTTAPTFATETLRVVSRKLRIPKIQAAAPAAPAALDGVPRRIAHLYGPRSGELMRYLESDPERSRPLREGCDTTHGEILFAIEREHARSLGDILLRRTGLAFEGRHEPSLARTVAEIFGPALGWDESRQSQELANYAKELAVTLKGCPSTV